MFEIPAVLLHGVHGGDRWTLPLILVVGVGSALLGRWLTRGGKENDDEPI